MLAHLTRPRNTGLAPGQIKPGRAWHGMQVAHDILSVFKLLLLIFYLPILNV
jgi:hypothetical protein